MPTEQFAPRIGSDCHQRGVGELALGADGVELHRTPFGLANDLEPVACDRFVHGDGGQGDPQGHGQDLHLLLGKILRIDVEHQEGNTPYAIANDNPFRNTAEARPEIWAYGLPEPWRFCLDRATGDLWVGDVGQDCFEEVALVRPGENQGWNVFEGFSRFSDRYRRDKVKYIPPPSSATGIGTASRSLAATSIAVSAPALRGWYICGDFESRRLWALTQQDRQLVIVVQIGQSPTRITSFAQDRDGELYLVGYDAGMIYRLGLEAVDPTPLGMRIVADTAETAPIQWNNTLQPPPTNWHHPDFDDATWANAPGGFGTSGTPGAVVRTDWRTGGIWLHREFILPKNTMLAKAESLMLRVHHDENAEVFLNGIEAARLSRWTSGYPDAPVSQEAARALHGGRNVIAIHPLPPKQRWPIY